MTDRDRLVELITEKQLWGIDQIQPNGFKIELFENLDLADYLIANGVILPPCKVGQIVWLVRDGKIEETTVEKIVLKDKGLYLKLLCNSFYETTCRSIGKTVFFTREEAEKALERSKG
jgi:hypothetical protein|nr:MAG TPA: hypothetical protein [Caudoviricetes sp.]